MRNVDSIKMLEAANPQSESSVDPQPKKLEEALFKEIIMSPVAVQEKVQNKEQLWSKPKFKLAIGFASVCAVALGAFAFMSSGDVSSASEEIAEAAENSARFTSGEFSSSFDISKYEGYETGKQTYIGTFSGDLSQGVLTDKADTDTPFANLYLVDSKTDTVYIKSLDKNVIETWSSSSLEEADMYGIDSDQLNPKALLSVIQETKDFTSSVNGDSKVYSGTLELSDLESLDPDEVPFGLSALLRHGDDSELPEVIDLKITVKDNLISEFKASIDSKNLVGTITTTYSNLGQPQQIQIPTTVNN